LSTKVLQTTRLRGPIPAPHRRRSGDFKPSLFLRPPRRGLTAVDDGKFCSTTGCESLDRPLKSYGSQTVVQSRRIV